MTQTDLAALSAFDAINDAMRLLLACTYESPALGRIVNPSPATVRPTSTRGTLVSAVLTRR